MKRTNDGGDGNSRKVEVESYSLQVELLNRLAHPAVQLRQQSAQCPKTLTSGGFVLRIANQQSQIRLQTTLDRLVKR